jgi:hypothetical protein
MPSPSRVSIAVQPVGVVTDTGVVFRTFKCRINKSFVATPAGKFTDNDVAVEFPELAVAKPTMDVVCPIISVAPKIIPVSNSKPVMNLVDIPVRICILEDDPCF